MKYSGTYPSVTSLQVGATAYIIYQNLPREVTIDKTEIVVTSGNEKVKYYFVEFPGVGFDPANVFADKATIKTDFQTDVDGL